MNSEQISYIALLASIISLIISFLTLVRDRHVISVIASAYETSKNVYAISIQISNQGKRPISVTHVTFKHPARKINHSFQFKPNDSSRIDVGDVLCQNFSLEEYSFMQNDLTELKKLEIFAEDAHGKSHKASWSGSKRCVW